MNELIPSIAMQYEKMKAFAVSPCFRFIYDPGIHAFLSNAYTWMAGGRLDKPGHGESTGRVTTSKLKKAPVETGA